ncbi:MAG: hypothetical protein QM760_21625 [Nibricoccus sp.]
MTFEDMIPGAIAFGLFAFLLLMLEWGRRVGAAHRERLMAGGASGLGTIEAAIFTLLGLLVAFTFQSAASRFDARRNLIVDEANKVGTAWLRIDLLPADMQPGMREFFRQYLDSRLSTYDKIPDMAAVAEAQALSARLQTEIWKIAISGEKKAGQSITVSLLPALNDMFDISTTRTWARKMHPPYVVFAMLLFMSCAGAFTAGHGMSGCKERSWIHSIGFSATLAFTIFVILDMEHPRLGTIRVDDFDQVLRDLLLSMQ